LIFFLDDGSLFSIGDDDDDDDDDNDDDGDINGLATPVTHPKCKALLLLGNTESLLIAKAISEVGGEERVGSEATMFPPIVSIVKYILDKCTEVRDRQLL
jgi:hypothetical protein